MTPAALQDASGAAAAVSLSSSSSSSSSSAPSPSPSSTAQDHPESHQRLREMFAQHFDFIWRSLRRFGLSDDRADDAAQQVFMIASRKLDAIDPKSERSFLFGTAMRVASDVRRSAHYRREVAHADPGVDLEGGARPDDLLDQRRARVLLDATLDAMELDLRSVFVLFEIEEMTTTEIAALLEIPHGTVASRLRRAREEFNDKLAKLQRSWRRGEPAQESAQAAQAAQAGQEAEKSGGGS